MGEFNRLARLTLMATLLTVDLDRITCFFKADFWPRRFPTYSALICR
jgi:hypothetical protein